MNEFKVRGEFSGHDCAKKPKRDGTDAWMGKVLVTVDNSYTVRGEQKVKMDTIPFDAYGKAAEEATKISFGDIVEVTFRPEGREWQGKHYAQLKLVNIEQV